MTKRLLKPLLLPILALATAFAFIACDGEQVPAVTYTVTYVIGENAQGTAPTETEKAAGEKFIIKSADGITCEGMKFMGWQDGSDVVYKAGDEYTMPSNAVTFTALWTICGDPFNTYSVTYNLNGGSGTLPTETDKAKGEKFNLATGAGLTNGEKEFDGWSDGDKKYPAGAEYTMPEKAVTLTAQWKDKSQEQPDEPDVLYSNYELDYKGTIFLYEGGTGMLDYTDVYGVDKQAKLTYTLSGTAIAVTIGGATFNGTYENKLLTIQITYAGTVYKFGKAAEQPTGKPTVTFDANGGTGTAPVIAEADITAVDDNYKIALPQNTYTAPAGKEFDGWCVNGTTDANGKEVKHSSKSYIAKPGEKVTLKALWKDAEDDTPTGTEYFGNCHIVDTSPLTPVDVYVKAIMFDAQKGKMYYRIDDSLTYKKSRSVINQDSDSDKPTDYGANAKFYEVIIEGKAFKLLVAADGSKVKLFNTTYEAVVNGEFNILNLDPTEYTVTFDPSNEQEAWVVTVSSIGIVQKPQIDPVHPAGKAFRYWKDDVTGKEYTFGSSPTGNLSLTAVYAWKVTFSAGEGTGTIAPLFINMWNATGVVLPDASDISNGSKIFAGWWDGTYDDDDPAVKNIYQPSDIYVGSGNVDFVAQWSVDNSYVVGFRRAVKYGDRNKVTGNDPELPAKIKAGTTFTAPENTYTFAGYEFDGWELHEYSADSTLGAKLGDYAAGDTITMPAKAVELVAKWKAATVTVTYKAGEHGTGADVVKDDVDLGQYTLLDCTFTVDTDYTFVGWKVEGDNSDAEPLKAGSKYTIAVNTVFVAQYVSANTAYTVTYILGDGATGTVPTETDKVAGAKFNLAAATGLANGDKEFDGWSDGTTKYAAGAEYTMPNHAVTFTAQWKSNAPLTWENINPESGALFDYVNSCENSEAIYLFDNPFVVGDYTFVGLKFYISKYNNITAGTNNPHLYVQPIFYKTADGKSATKAGTGLACKSADNTDATKLRYTSNSYAINVQTSGGTYYVTSFKYGSANPETAMQVELVYTTKTVDDLKAEQ